MEKLEELNEIFRVNQRVITGITTIQSDSEAVFVKGEVQRYCINNGMMQEKSPPFVHEMNGLVESAIKTDFITARACLIASGLRKGLWWWALQHTAHTRFVTLASEGYGRDQTPFETWFGYRPDVSYLRPFGASVYHFVGVKGKGEHEFDTVSKIG